MSYPSWRYGPNGAAQIFQSEEDVPEGWYDHPSLVPDEPGNAEALSEINALRAAYQEKFGKRPFMGWDEATLREKLG
jgi:hypothetical protein